MARRQRQMCIRDRLASIFEPQLVRQPLVQKISLCAKGMPVNVLPAPAASAALPTSSEGSPALVVHGTLRGGQSIEHAGAVVLIGDVNAGAQVIAGGDVIIWGRLRGIVHASAWGDQPAVVCALVLQPTQLRIGNAIGRAPDPSGQRWRLPLRQSRAIPEVARVIDGAIVIEPWDQVKN